MPRVTIRAEDVLRCDSPWRDYEIWDGIPVLCEPCGGRSSHVGLRTAGRLIGFVESRDLGWAFGSDQGFLLARDPDRLLEPDGAFVSKERLPSIPREGFIELAPDFLVEVRSPTDSWEAAVEKCGVWLAHGAQCAWAIDPPALKVAIFRPGVAPEVLQATGTARADPALEGFQVALSDLFKGLD